MGIASGTSSLIDQVGGGAGGMGAQGSGSQLDGCARGLDASGRTLGLGHQVDGCMMGWVLGEYRLDTWGVSRMDAASMDCQGDECATRAALESSAQGAKRIGCAG